MAVDLATVKAHLVIEHAQDDALLIAQITAAEHYLRSIGVGTADNPSRDQAVLLLVSTWYEVRLAADFKPTQENAHAVAALIAPHRESFR